MKMITTVTVVSLYVQTYCTSGKQYLMSVSEKYSYKSLLLVLSRSTLAGLISVSIVITCINW